MVQATARLLKADADSISEAARLVLAGRLVAYPTDTVYGLGCNPYDKDAIDRLIQAKQRQKGALPILVNSMASAKKLAEFSQAAMNLAGRYWPGPLTLVLPLRAQLPAAVTDDSPFVGLRIPRHEVALNLAEKCGGQIIGTSANLTGQPATTSAQTVLEEMGDLIDLILDGGPPPRGKESTVVKVLGGSIDVLREGSISRDDVLKAVKVG